MKNSIFSLSVLFVLLSFFSCNKEDNTPANFFSCKVDGEMFEVTALIDANAYRSSDYIEISGDRSGLISLNAIYLYIPLNATKGTYVFGPNHYAEMFVGFSAYATYYGMGSGSITIEDINASFVKGTFQFIAYDSNTETTKKTVTEGKFRVEFL